MKQKQQQDNNITLTSHRYVKTFQTFLKHSTEYKSMINELQRIGKELSSNNNNKYNSNSNSSNGFSCLDIGAGTGELIYNWINNNNNNNNSIITNNENDKPSSLVQQQQQQKQPCNSNRSSNTCYYPSRYVAIEPNIDHVISLQEKIKLIEKTITNNNNNSSSTNFSSKVISSEFTTNFYLDDNNEEKFDMILFSHSLYYIQQPEQCVIHALQTLLKHNGKIIIFIQGPYGLYTLNHLYQPIILQKQQQQQQQNCCQSNDNDDTTVIANHMISSHEIIQALQQYNNKNNNNNENNINNNECNININVTAQPAIIDFTNLFDNNNENNNNNEDELNDIISFMLQIEMNNINDNDELKQNIYQTLQYACCNNNNEKLLYLHHPTMILEITNTN